MPTKDRRDYYNHQLSGLKKERESFDAHWKELAQFVKPRRGRFFVSDRNKGDKRWNNIINNKATRALRICRSGMLAGTMSPSRPWIVLEPHKYSLRENQQVRMWLHQVEQRLHDILNEGNFYTMAPQLLEEQILFGTGAMTHVDDFENVARFYTHTVGSYYIAQNDRLQVDTFIREFEWTAEQMVKAFGKENLSRSVKTALDQGNYQAWFPVVHIIEKNEDYKPSSSLITDAPWKSVYYEPGNHGEDRDKYLRVSGFRQLPGYFPRWDATGEDVYATNCPAMETLGDIKQLQLEEKRKAQGIEKGVNPPLTGPSSVGHHEINALPGGLTLFDGDDTRQSLRPLYDVNLNLQELRLDMDAVERRIEETFYVDMFLAISEIEGIQPRNQYDLIQRNEERLLQLGPVLERIHGEFLKPLVERLFNQAMAAGILPEAPRELENQALRIRFVSTLATAQKAVATQDIDRLAAFTGNLAGMGFENALRKFDAEQAVDEYARAMGAPPSLIVSDDVVAQQKFQEEQQLAAMQQIEAAQGMASAAQSAGAANKSLAETGE